MGTLEVEYADLGVVDRQIRCEYVIGRRRFTGLLVNPRLDAAVLVAGLERERITGNPILEQDRQP